MTLFLKHKNNNKKQLVAYTQATEMQGKWPVIILWIVHQLLWYATTFLIYFDISFDSEIKRKNKKMLLLQEDKKGKKEKKFDMHPPGIEPRSTDSESDVLTTLPSMP